MPVPRPILLLLAVSILAIPLAAQQTASTSPATSDPQAVTLLQKSLVALTGGASVTDATLTGTARRIAGSDDETGSATLEATSLGDSRVELSFASGNRIEIRNHSSLPLAGALPPGIPPAAAEPVGEWVGPDGVGHAMAAHNVMTDSAWFFPALTLQRLLAASNYVLSYVGQETHNGAAVLHVAAVEQFPQLPTSASTRSPGLPAAQLMQHLSQMDFYFDPASALPVALDFTEHPDTDALIDIAVEIRFLGYRAESGISVPIHIQEYFNNGLALDVAISNAAVNSGLPPSTFAIQ